VFQKANAKISNFLIIKNLIINCYSQIIAKAFVDDSYYCTLSKSGREDTIHSLLFSIISAKQMQIARYKMYAGKLILPGTRLLVIQIIS
jgi:hypothetical protein